MIKKGCPNCSCYSKNKRDRGYCQYLKMAIAVFPEGFYCNAWSLHPSLWRPFYVMEKKDENYQYWRVVYYPESKASPSILCEDTAFKFAQYLNGLFPKEELESA